jgi:hypothetical protein
MNRRNFLIGAALAPLHAIFRIRSFGFRASRRDGKPPAAAAGTSFGPRLASGRKLEPVLAARRGAPTGLPGCAEAISLTSVIADETRA